MKKKVVVVGRESLSRIIAGANFAANAIKLTLGPYGRNFVSGIRGGPVTVSNDGVSLARLLQGKDEIEDLGVRAVCEGCVKTNDIAGDGTTTAAVLLQAVLQALDAKLNLSDTEVFGARTAAQLIEQVGRECKEVVVRLKARAAPIERKEQLVAVARVSGEYPELAEMIGGAQWDLGKYGVVVAEEGNAATDSLEMVHGIRIDNGYTTSRIINNQERQSLELENVRIILTSKHFTGNLTGLDIILPKLIEEGASNVLLMGAGFDEGAIGTCVKNIQQGALKIYPVNAPYVDRNEIMEDLAAVVGGRYINTAERNLETMLISDVGFAAKIVFKRMEGIVIGKPMGMNETIDKRIEARVVELEEKLKGEISPFERKHLESRRAQLAGGTATIKVGAETDQERKHKKDKVDDAVNAVKAAMEEGIVPGGGVALCEIAEDMPDTCLIKNALRAPYEQIKALAPARFVVEDWVKDPVKVVRVALEKACSIAGSLATGEVAINWEFEKPQYVTSVDNRIGEQED